MSDRKRRFEFLEDRRLLALLVGPAPSAPSTTPTAAEVAPAVPASTASSGASSSEASSSTSDASTSTPDGDAGDNPAEYAIVGPTQPASLQSASPASDATGSSVAASNSYASDSYTNNYNYSYGSNSNGYDAAAAYPSYSAKTSSTSHSSNSSTGVTPTVQLAANDVSNVATKGSDALAISLAGSTSAPAVGGSPPAAGSTSPGVIGNESDDGTVTGGLTALPAQAADDPLIAPVALEDAPSDQGRPVLGTFDVEAWFSQAERAVPAAEFASRIVVGAAALDTAMFEEGIDAIFAGIDRLSGEVGKHSTVSRLGEWLVLAGGACAAFEFARARYREEGPWQATSWPVLCEPRLRRRWFAGRRRHDV